MTTETPEARARRYAAGISAGVLSREEVDVLENAHILQEFPGDSGSRVYVKGHLMQAAKSLTSTASEPEGIEVPVGWEVTHDGDCVEESYIDNDGFAVAGTTGAEMHTFDTIPGVPLSALALALRAAGWVVGRPRG